MDMIKLDDLKAYRDNRIASGDSDFDEMDRLSAFIANVETVGWIPCGERLPSENGYYLCCNKGYLPYVGNFLNGRWNDFDCTIVHADAWMPLPKPWKGADDD